MQNSVNLTGRITRDIEVKTFDSGDRITNFTLAVNRNYKNKNGDYDCDFINCKARNGTADLLYNFFHKGDFCPITGELYTRKYEYEGQNRIETYVNVSQITFVNKNNNNTPAQSTQAQQQVETDFDNFTQINEDDLPF